MPRFFFHLHNDVDVSDDEGTELPDLEAATAEAKRHALHLIGETIKDTARLVLHHRIDIEDEAGGVLGTVWFSDVVCVES